MAVEEEVELAGGAGVLKKYLLNPVKESVPSFSQTQ